MIKELLEDVAYRNFKIVDDSIVLDEKLEELINGNENTFLYVGTLKFVTEFFSRNANTKYKLRGVFFLGFPFNVDKQRLSYLNNSFVYTNFFYDWYLFYFSKEESDNIFLGINTKKTNFSNYDFRHEENQVHDSNSILDFYIRDSFYFLIEDCIAKEKIPILPHKTAKEIGYDFVKVPKSCFDLVLFEKHAERYLTNTIEDFGFPKEQEKEIALETIVEFLFTEPNRKYNVKQGDLIIEKFFYDDETNELERSMRIAEQNENNVYACNVIRSYSVSIYYVWAQLESDYIREVIQRESEEGNLHVEIDYYGYKYVDLKSIKIIEPEYDYKTAKYFKKKYDLEKINKSFCFNYLRENTNICRFYDSDARDVILGDLIEIKDCFITKAYKAAIILSGSVLEAFLIDWLSEIKGINYFEKNFMIGDRVATLKDYIDQIRELKKPSWFDASEKANIIRNKRNLVHAKLYINDADISRETCTEVINYLEYVINTRWAK